MPQSVVWQLKLKTDEFARDIAKVAESMDQLNARFSKQLMIKINLKQFEALKQSFTDLGTSMKSAMDANTSRIVESLDKISVKATASKKALQAAYESGSEAASKSAAIEKAVSERLTAQLEERAKKFEDAYRRMSAAQKRHFDESGLPGPGDLMTRDARGAGFMDQRKVGDVTRAFKDATDLADMNKRLATENKAIIDAQNADVVRMTQIKTKAAADELTNLDKIAAANKALAAGNQTAIGQENAEIVHLTKLKAEAHAKDLAFNKTLAVDNKARIDKENADIVRLGRANVQARADEAKANARGKKDLSDQGQLQNQIGVQLLTSVARATKLFLMYRLIREVTSQIEGAFHTIVSSGLEYTKAQETQKLGLQGILAENFKINDAQGRELTGAVALGALQQESAKQWRQLQSASLSVVGTTEDLVTVYSGILPFASRLGRNLQEIQQMTKGTAVAASLMGISFQDARAAMIAMLQGRAPTRNRLVGMLGITKDDLKDVAGRFDVIMGKLGEFNALAGEAQLTLAASTETIQEFIAMIGAAVVGPGVDAFKKFVQYVTKSLFELSKSGDFLPTAAFHAFLTNIGTAISQVLAPLTQFGQELIKQGATSATTWMVGMVNLLKPLVTLVEWFGRASIAIVTFAARNSETIKWAVYIAGALAFAQALRSLANAINATMVAQTYLGQMFSKMGNAMVATTSATGQATAAAVGFAGGLRMLASAGAIGLAVATIGYLIQRLIDFAKAGRVANEVANLLKRGDTAGATLKNEELWSLDPSAAARKGEDTNQTALAQLVGTGMVSMLDPAKSEDKSLHIDTKFTDAKLTAWDNETAALSKSQQALVDNMKNLRGQDKEDAQNALLNSAKRMRQIKAEQEDYQIRRGKMKDAAGSFQRAQAAALAAEEEAQALDKEAAGTSAGADTTLGQIAIGPRGDGATAANLSSDTKKSRKQELLDRASALHAQAKEMQDLANKGRDLLAVERELQALDDKHALKPEPKPVEPTTKLQRPETTDSYDEIINTERSHNARMKSEDELRIANAKTWQEEADAQKAATANEIERQEHITKVIGEQWVKRRVDYYTKYLPAVNAYNAQQKADGGTIITPEEQKERLDKINLAAARHADEAAILQNDTERAAAERAKAFNAALDRFDEELAKREADITHQEGARAAAQWRKRIQELKQEFAAAETPEQRERAEAALKSAIAITDRLKAAEDLDDALKNNTSTMAALDEEERRTQKAFDNGTISANEYAKAMVRVRMEQRATLLQDIELLKRHRQQITTVPPGEVVNQSEVDETDAKINAAIERLKDLKNNAGLAKQALDEMIEALNGLGNLLKDIFDTGSEKVDGFREKLAFVTDTISGAINAGKQFLKILDDIRKVSATIKTIRMGSAVAGVAGGGGGGSLGSLASLGGAAAGIGGGSGTAAGLLAPGVISGSSVGGSGIAASTTLGLSATAWTGVGLAAVAAIYIGRALYSRAVKKAVDSIEKGMNSITDALNNGAIDLGEATKMLREQRERESAMRRGSKSGRKALEQTKPEFDKLMDDMDKKRAEATKAFDERIADTMSGSGAFGDFNRMLIELGRTSEEFLKHFEKGTAGYANALVKIRQLYDAQIKQAKKQLEEEFAGFEDEAIQQAESVISLMEAREQLWTQLGEQHEQLLQVEEARQQLIKDEAQDTLDNAKARKDRLEEILDLEKQIADVLKKAADDEAAIRQKGVLEATETIAQQKAREINSVRNDALDQLGKLNPQLDEKRKNDDLEKHEAELLASYEKRTKELDKQYTATIKALENTEKQLQLNEISVGTAQRIKDLYSGVFDVSGDIYDLERRRGNIEVANAGKRVEHWKEVRDLIDSISQTAAGVHFEPPTGFPAIDITIGDINIDNSLTDNSQHSQAAASSGPWWADEKYLVGMDKAARLRWALDHISDQRTADDYQRQYGAQVN